MDLLVFAFILFNLLVRCLSDVPTNTIHLVATEENVHVIDNMPISLISYKPFIIMIRTNYSYDEIKCHTDVGMYTKNLENIEKSENYYYVAGRVTAAMAGTWKCLLRTTTAPYETLPFDIRVNVSQRAYEPQLFQKRPQKSDEDNYLALFHKYHYMRLVPNTHNTSISRNSHKTISDTNKTNAAQSYSPENNDTYTHSNKQQAKEENMTLNIDPNTLAEIFGVVIVLTGIIVGVIVGIVCWKLSCRRRSTEGPVQSDASSISKDHVYEELDYSTQVPDAAACNVACRPPCPLPPEAREENKKYIHYDTPYDHRFDRPIPLRICRAHHLQRNARMLRNV